MFSISHPDKYGRPLLDLSKDSEASIPASTLQSLCHSQVAVERVITKTFTRYRCDVVVTDRLRSVFTSKLWRIGKAIQSLGGTARSKLIDRWKSTKWTLELAEDEIICNKRKSQNPIVVNEREKVRKLEEDLKEANKRLQDVTKQMDLVQKSAKKLINPHNPGRSLEEESLSRRRKRKSWSECSGQYQRRRRAEVANSVCAALSIVEDNVFKASRVELINNETKEVLVVEETGKSSVHKPPTECEQNSVIEKTLYIKEKHNISNKAYHELAMVNKAMPRSCALTKCARELDTHSEIRQTPGKAQGVQQSLKMRLKTRIQVLLQKNPALRSNPHLRVKITGDGTQISRSMHTVVIAFTLMEEGNANSPSGNHSIAIMNLSEDYEELAESLQDVVDEVSSLQTVTVDGTEFDIEVYLGADLKFLAIVTGIQSATATYSCVWCKCSAAERYKGNIHWSYSDTEKGARTISEIKKLSNQRSRRGVETYGCVSEPIFSIPIDHIVPDILHLFLRISDVLTNLLILELRRLDGTEKAQTFNRDKSANMAQYEHFLNHQCKISFKWHINKESKTLQWRDLTGPEKLRLFQHINIPDLFPRLPESQKL